MEIIVETSYYQTVYPAEKHEVGSFVGKFCKDNGISLPIPFEAATVIMNVQSLLLFYFMVLVSTEKI